MDANALPQNANARNAHRTLAKRGLSGPETRNAKRNEFKRKRERKPRNATFARGVRTKRKGNAMTENANATKTQNAIGNAARNAITLENLGPMGKEGDAAPRPQSVRGDTENRNRNSRPECVNSSESP